MNLNEIKPKTGSRKKRTRIGCGPGSGHGKMSTFGMKGQGARNRGVRLGFEGGQMSLVRRTPKRGFKNTVFAVQYAEVTLRDLDNKFNDGEQVTIETLQKKGLVPMKYTKFKVLASGELTKKLTVVTKYCTKKAAEMIKAKSGEVKVNV